MTGREMINSICCTAHNLDADLPILLLHRDTNNCVIGRQQIAGCIIINGKLLIEADSIGPRID